MDNEIVAASQFGLSMGRSPSAVLAEAHTAAKSLKDLISKKKKPVMMNGEQYLEFEDWQTVGGFYGAKAKVVGTEYVEIGNAKGFKARAVVVDGSGNEISSAEALCLNDEEKWSTRSKFEWKDGKKEKVGDVPVPTFQLMSMAQTRACAKALRNVFAWVVVLAGYAPTPAEDMTGDETGGAPAREPIKSATPKEATPGGAPSGDVISEPQGKRLYAIFKGSGKTAEQMAGYLKNTYGISNSREIKKSDYEAVCTWAAEKSEVGDAQE